MRSLSLLRAGDDAKRNANGSESMLCGANLECWRWWHRHGVVVVVVVGAGAVVVADESIHILILFSSLFGSH